MKLKVVDYFSNTGGGARFYFELIKAISELTDHIQIEIVSHGGALSRYQSLFSNASFISKMTDIPPANSRSDNFKNIRGTWRLMRRMGIAESHYDIPSAAINDADVIWCPWAQKHRIPADCSKRVIATYHDLNIFEMNESGTELEITEECDTLLAWLHSNAKVVTSSDACAKGIVDRVGFGEGRINVIPLAGMHAQKIANNGVKRKWKWGSRPYLLCAANTMPHKNHETLFRGVGAWGHGYPLVLTGIGTELPWYRSRGIRLRTVAAMGGFNIGKTLFLMGYVDNPTYFQLLRDAWAMIMPTLAEGGGSFPVWEALWCGLPVICSDLPVIREMLHRSGGEAILFDPLKAEDLLLKLQHLEANYNYYRDRAIGQISHLKERSWREVAEDYLSVMDYRTGTP